MAIIYSALATGIDIYEMISIVYKCHQYHAEGAVVIHEFGTTVRSDSINIKFLVIFFCNLQLFSQSYGYLA